VADLVVRAAFNAAAESVWAALTDWPAHDQWMLFTRASGGHGVGEPIEAFTGVGPVGFTDTMRILVWEPPHRAVVRHTGRVVRGSGSFEVRDLGGDRSLVVWSEWVEPPFGVVGRLGWPLVRPLLRFGVSFSLRRLARQVETAR
jgi:hypothetical protein